GYGERLPAGAPGRSLSLVASTSCPQRCRSACGLATRPSQGDGEDRLPTLPPAGAGQERRRDRGFDGRGLIEPTQPPNPGLLPFFPSDGDGACASRRQARVG